MGVVAKNFARRTYVHMLSPSQISGSATVSQMAVCMVDISDSTQLSLALHYLER